ncbi:MAG: glycoside hydrolase family 3 N-terminal domain-containing protein [Roseibium sp.]|uniref:glycoside hydrolase family 3 protein n=1 Tax=Roseibium sp. TaxID=1936156 RepID=UPI003D9C4E61
MRACFRILAIAVPVCASVVIAHNPVRPASAAEVSVGTAVPLEAVPVRQKIGQMILVGFVGNSPSRTGVRRVLEQLEAGEIGGVLYLGRNLKNKQTVQRMNAAFREAAPAALPPLIAIDQEGGRVQRLRGRDGFPETPSAKQIARKGSPNDAESTYRVLAKNLADWGFTLTLGPVVDVDANPRNPIIGRLGRSYSSDPKRVAAFGAAFVSAHRAQGILTALKHFPGHGSSLRDSHKGAVDITRTWSQDELIPFRELIADGMVDLVMTAHVINRTIEQTGKNVPMSLSRDALAGMLRGDLGFTGVIISDDIQMDAIRWNFSLRQAVLKAVMAETDILLFANDKRPDPGIPRKVADILETAAKNDPDLARKIDAAYSRIVTLKSRLLASAEISLDASQLLTGTHTAIVEGEHLCALEPAQ